MAKKDKTDRKSFEDMRAGREADVKASLEAASDRMADAQGEAMLANINRRIDEAKGEEERKRNYHLLQQAAIRENENSRVKNTSVNVGAPQSPLNFEQEDISGNADKTFKRSMAKNQYGVRQDFGKRALAAEAEAAIAASDKMADGQEDDALANIKSLIAKRERDIADRRASEERKQKYLSDQQAAINANKKPAEVPETPAVGGQKKTEVPGKTEVTGEAENVRYGRAARAANYDANSTQETPATPARGENVEAEAENRAAAGRAARAAKYEEENKAEVPATPARSENEEAEVPGETDVPGGEAGKKPAASPAPIVHNSEERFQKNLEDVQGKLKYEPILEIIRKYQEEQQRLADNRTPEQKKKAARREKMAKIFAALGDGVAAMSNLVLTSKGAIPYQSKSMISKAVGDRYDKFSKDLENRKAKYLELSEKIAKLQQGVEDSKAEDERLKKARERQEEQDKMNKELHRLKMAGLELDNEHTQAQIQKIKNDDAYREKALQVKKAIAELNAMSREKAARIRAAGGRGRTTYTTPWDGKTYSNLAEYKAAVDEAAILYDVQDYKTVNYQSGFKTNQRVMPKSTSQKAAEITQKSKEARGGEWGCSIHKK